MATTEEYLAQLKNDLLDVGLDGLTEVLQAVREGKVTPEQGRDLIVDTIAAAVDAAVPTGPFDTMDDEIIRSGVEKAYDLIASLTRRDPVKLRAKAAEALAEGKTGRHDRLVAAAERIESRA